MWLQISGTVISSVCWTGRFGGQNNMTFWLNCQQTPGANTHKISYQTSDLHKMYFIEVQANHIKTRLNELALN